jgi:hypothetical protein
MQICRYKLENNTLNSVLDSDSNKTITKKICWKGPKFCSAKPQKVIGTLYALVGNTLFGKIVWNMVSLKVEVKSILRIDSAHNNVRTLSCKHCPNFDRMFRIFLNINSISYSFRSIANQNGVRYSDSTSYFRKYSSSKCNQTICLHYGLDFHFNF